VYDFMEFIDVVPKIVEGFNLKKDSMVLIHFWGEDDDLEILDRFAVEVAKAGACPVRWQQSRQRIKDYFAQVPAENLTFPDKYFDVFKSADVVIDILTYSPTKPHKDFPKDKMPMFGAYMRKLFPALTQDKEMFIQLRVPTEENAQEAGIDYGVFKASMLNALDVDYKKMKADCEQLAANLKDKKNVTIYTKDDKRLTFSIEGREWFGDYGNGDIPCGEVYIAPVEESANGEILIPMVILEGQRFSEVLMEFKQGKLVACSAPEILEYIQSAPGDSDVIGEFGIGLNENVKEMIGYQVIDEKAKGTIHIAVGMNDYFGGKNQTPLHMDFILTAEKVEIEG
jgi:aminopeptidase